MISDRGAYELAQMIHGLEYGNLDEMNQVWACVLRAISENRFI